MQISSPYCETTCTIKIFISCAFITFYDSVTNSILKQLPINAYLMFFIYIMKSSFFFFLTVVDWWSQWPWLSYSCNKMQVAFNQVGMQRMHKTEAKGKSMRSSHRCYRKNISSYIIFITELFFHISKMNRAISRVWRKLALFCCDSWGMQFEKGISYF